MIICFLAYLGNNLIVSAGRNDLELTLRVPPVKGETVVFIGLTLLSNNSLVPGLILLLLVSNHCGCLSPLVFGLAGSAVIENLLEVDVLDLDLGLLSKDSGSASGLKWGLNTVRLLIVPVLILPARFYLPCAVVGVAEQVLLTVVGSGGSDVDFVSGA